MADRDMDFRMERPGLVEEGQHVTMTESVLKTLSLLQKPSPDPHHLSRYHEFL